MDGVTLKSSHGGTVVVSCSFNWETVDLCAIISWTPMSFGNEVLFLRERDRLIFFGPSNQLPRRALGFDFEMVLK